MEAVPPVANPRVAAMFGRVLADTSGTTGTDDEIRTRILDAAREQFSAIGVRHSTMDDVARRAGVARITVYRRFPTKDALVEQVTLREYRRYFDRFLVDIRDADTVEDRVVLGFVSSLRAIRGNPIVEGLLTADPDLLAHTMVGDDGSMVAVVRQFVSGQLRREQAAGHVAPEADVDLVAEMMVRVSASFLTTPSEIVDIDDDEQLAGLARRFLVPMLAVPPLPERR
ncbi:putative TetR family transcriptional regulator [Gordonia araii NBRC 100433]|uniref:Putative TetR family transcriptional regulator n=1 Tax=Gordonia araii NBRC 100433 TaxID=1073574 RepID=G7H5M7_9ACTN|nr:TetR/AcrR family transcriptional regulator [Gordonia araii NBRC 100433]GAB11152.1 putative TetR family transcriptional regulator [Gordonia araii NBRC 100433]